MDREKYRAWTGKEMIYNYISFSKTPTDWLYCNAPYIHGVKAIMQFTRLLDRNQKEIYVSDVLHFLDYTMKYYNTNKKRVIGVVEKVGGGFCCNYFVEGKPETKTFQPMCCNFYPGSVEIIGNQYENLKLLKGE